MVVKPRGLKMRQLSNLDPIDKASQQWRSGRAFIYQIERSLFEAHLGVVAKPCGLKMRHLSNLDLIDKTSQWWHSGRAFVYQTKG